MNNRNLYIALVLAFMTLCNESKSQHVSFEKLINEDQSIGFIIDVVQDTHGYIWFATVTGLYRYDGHTIKGYTHDPANKNASLAGSFINAIHPDPDGGLWLSIYPTGFYYFNTLTEEFSAYRRNSMASNTLSSDSVLSLWVDRSGLLWIGTENGLNRYDRKTQTYTNYHHREDDPGSLSHPFVSTIYEDSRGTLWVGTGFDLDNYININGAMPPGGLNKFDSNTGKFKRILYQPGVTNGLQHNIITRILDDGNGTLWIGTLGNGLHTLSLRTDSITHHAYSSVNPENLSAPYSELKMTLQGVSGIIKDDKGNIWISSYNAGISRWNPETHVLTRFDKAFSDNPIDMGIWNLFKSKDGIIWLTTEASNVYRLNPSADIIGSYAKNFSINGFAEDQNKHLWIATSTGLLKVDSAHVILQRYSEGNFHGNVTVSRDGKIWYGSRNILECYDPRTKSIKKYTKTIENGYRGGNSTHIMEDRDGDIWIASRRSLQRLNPITETVSQYILVEVDTSGQSWSWWRSKHILEDKAGYLWVSTSNGIIRLDKQTNKTEPYLSGYKVTMSFLDHSNTLWVGTYDGLFYKEEKSDIFVEYRSDLVDFSRSAIISILEDDNHHLWVASFLGLIQLDQSRKNLITYSNSSGVDAFNFNILSSFKSSSGSIYIGSQYGYISFNPGDLNQNKILPELRVSDFRINEQPLREVYPVTNDSFDDGKLIALKYDENTLSIAMSLLHYVNVDRHELYYQLQNYDKEWRKAGPDRMAYYFQIPPGEYTFLLKGSAGNGLWVERSLGIIISPPWWNTGWAYSFYILIAVLSVWSIVQWRTRSLNLEKETLEQRVIQRTDELRKEKEKAEATLQELKATQNQLIQSEKMASLGELTAGIAHEIQNPLNFVNNFKQ
jgi:ligand-binding sensor domain-containing protein